MVLVACNLLEMEAQVLSTKEYIDAYKFAAMQEMKIYNIPASITLGQGILESASGNSKLATECNNHFGIKCRKEWTGAYCLADDDAPNECFRGYASAMESYRDHSLFLSGSQRYQTLFTLQATDYRNWAEGLRTAGYATNPAYAKTLIGVIERYRLTMYDSMVVLGEDFIAPDTAAQKIISKNGLPAVYAKAGQTPAQIAKEHEMGAWQIYRYNDLKRGESLDPGEIVYLKPKKRKGTVAVVTVKEGESMRDISQEYGIKLRHLYKKNRLKPGMQVKAGEVLSLQRKSAETPVVMTKDEIEEADKPISKSADPANPVTPSEKLFHEVKSGETLYSIAAKYGVAVEDLMRWNNLGGNSLKAGQVLVLKKSVKYDKGDSKDTSAGAAQVKSSVKYHIVMSGETLYSISKLYNQPVDSIKIWNNLADNSIKPGQELIVNKWEKKYNSIPGTYTVHEGDTLYSISRKFGISVADLKMLNSLNSNAIVPGMILKLK